MLYFNILVQTKRFRCSVLTNNLRVIRHAWHFYYALIFVIKVVQYCVPHTLIGR
ncbi:DUF3265 domain-containing protein [Vibrio alginolyticus]